MGMLKGHLKVELSENEQLTLHHTVSQLPELAVQLQRITSRVEIPYTDRNACKDG